ncbi:NADPH-dependent FMN reductase [Flavobacterium silvaticum]|uniref:NAD(P)H-dependent oxidoreductase n=1 Tax=Flavobacterium silvaticum TaxID=1852020 RepID=A0A972FKF0_9FLAO|nr:NAD(P)H-dependent oxidoreductase [Flavobacterium silvaticum]NMH26860.1 NAD(P)H-dependent oxidoreductase [Flavobacterium silvaticum]
MKIIAFAGSPSSHSINKKLVTYTCGLFENTDVEILDINDFEMPLFSVDREASSGKHRLAQAFLDKIGTADLLVISLAENNGIYSAAFKNLFDWCSRIRKDVFQQKPTLLMATSPGQRGGKGVLGYALENMGRYGMDIRDSFSLPSFPDNFDIHANRISNPLFDEELREKVSAIQKQLL